MYKHIAFNDVALNFLVQFKMPIFPYYDRFESNKSGKLVFLSAKFVKYLMTSRGYGGSAKEPLKEFITRRFGEAAWTLLNRLMK